MSAIATTPSSAPGSGAHEFQGPRFVNGDVVGLQALDDVLRVGFRCVMCISFEADIRHDLPDDRSPNTTRFRVPFDPIAALEGLPHTPARPKSLRLGYR